MVDLRDPTLDQFIDAVWLEDGLSDNTLAAYRRDLQGLLQWAQAQRGGSLRLTDLTELDLRGHAVAVHATTRPSTANSRASYTAISAESPAIATT